MLDGTRTYEAQLVLPAPSLSLQGQVPLRATPQANVKAADTCRDVDRVVDVSALHSMLRCALNAVPSSIILRALRSVNAMPRSTLARVAHLQARIAAKQHAPEVDL